MLHWWGPASPRIYQRKRYPPAAECPSQSEASPRSRYPRSFRFLTLLSSQREQAEEGQYIRRREQELLKAAQEKLKAAQAEVDKHQATVDASNAKDKK